MVPNHYPEQVLHMGNIAKDDNLSPFFFEIWAKEFKAVFNNIKGTLETQFQIFLVDKLTLFKPGAGGRKIMPTY